MQCADCGLAYLPEIPSGETIEREQDWNESFSRERRRRWLSSPWMRGWTMALMFLKPSRERRAMRRIVRFAPPGRMLDVGCGDGRLAGVALRYGFDPLGIELSPQMAAKAIQRLGSERVLRGRLEDFNLEPRSFDVVVTVSYLEHEPNPRDVLSRIFHLLRPGGVCVHKVPNHGSLLRRVLGRRWSGYRWPEHFQYYTPKTLGHMATEVGFEVLRTDANPLSDNLWLTAIRPRSPKTPRGV